MESGREEQRLVNPENDEERMPGEGINASNSTDEAAVSEQVGTTIREEALTAEPMGVTVRDPASPVDPVGTTVRDTGRAVEESGTTVRTPVHPDEFDER